MLSLTSQECVNVSLRARTDCEIAGGNLFGEAVFKHRRRIPLDLYQTVETC